jgi:hypothetical protein
MLNFSKAAAKSQSNNKASNSVIYVVQSGALLHTHAACISFWLIKGDSSVATELPYTKKN